MRFLHINRYHNTEGEAGISQHFPLHISNLCLRNITKHTDVKFVLPKIFTKSRWKNLVKSRFSCCNFFSKWPINRSFNVVKNPYKFKSSSLHLSKQFCFSMLCRRAFCERPLSQFWCCVHTSIPHRPDVVSRLQAHILPLFESETI